VKGDFIVGCFAEFSKYLLHLKPDGPHEAADDVEVVEYNILFLFLTIFFYLSFIFLS
jgi:hypothetical protein